MKFYITFSLLVFLYSSLSLANDNILELPIIRVVDGDTIETRVAQHPTELQKIYVRLKGIDTPELHGKCDKEKKIAQDAKLFLTKLLKSYSMMQVHDVSFDKYGQRIVGSVFVKDIHINQLMIDQGFAVSYTGQGQKKNWCQ